MSAIFELQAEKRSDMGKGASRRLRRLQNKIPAIIYGGSDAPESIVLDHNKVLQATDHESFFSHILTIIVDGKKQKAVLKDIQRHPFKPRVLHIDFLRISANEPITMNVPIHFLNSDTAPGLKKGGILQRTINEINIKCLPDKLPEYLELELGNLDLDQVLHLSDIKLPEGVEILELSHGKEHDQPIASIHLKRGDEEEVEAEESTEAAAEGEAGDKGKEKTKEDKK